MATLTRMPLDSPMLILLDQRLIAGENKKQPFILTKKSKHLLKIAV